MALKVSTIRPGVLVSLKTALRGNVRYYTTDIERDHVLENGLTRRAEWNTQRTIDDGDEYERAVKARSKARSIVTGVCTQGNFLLCPQASRDNLETAIREAYAVRDAFNSSATVSRLDFYVFLTEVASDDVRAFQAINSEVRDLLADMGQGIAQLDAKAIRDAANKAQSIGKMLTPEAADRLQASIDAVRKQARAIVKAGETAAVEVDQTVFRTLAESRTAFLELEPVAEVAAPEAEGRGVDFDAPTSTAIDLPRPAPEVGALDL